MVFCRHEEAHLSDACPGVGMPGMEHKPFLWEKLKPVRSVAVAGHHEGRGSDEPTSPPLAPSHMVLSPCLCRSSSASLQFFSEDIIPCAAGMRCVPGAGRGGGGAVLEFRIFPCQRLGLPSHFYLNWDDYALLQEPVCISVSVLFTHSYCG